MSTLTPIGARLEIALDAEYLRMQNEWFFKWHHIGRDSVVEIDGFDGRMIRYGGIKFSGTARDVYWGTIQRYARQKVGQLFDDLETELLKYPLEIRSNALNEVQSLIRVFVERIRRAAVDKDRTLRGNGITFPPQQDLGKWAGAQPLDIESRIATLRHIYCELDIAKPPFRVPRLTIDTNCFINLFDTGSSSSTSVDELRMLVRYAMESKAEIAVTTRLEADLRRDKDETRRKALLETLNMFPVISTVGRWDVSKWDEDLWVGDRTARLNQEIQQILSPGLSTEDPRFSNKINDIDHLTGHLIDGRDIFVTDDKGILRRRDQLSNGPGIIVMTPAQALKHVDDIALRSVPRTLPTRGLSPDYHSRALRGTVTFDYTNNNHAYALGESLHLFETKWSKASNTAIYAYSDGASIEAIAVAKGAGKITDIINAEAYDFSSRVRTPQIGQVVIWRNVNGLYGATHIVKITDDTRGDDTNELTFDYVLLADGRQDFSTS